MKYILLFFLSGIVYSCSQPKVEMKDKTYTVQEIFQTERDEAANMDSPAVWHGPDNQNWIILTAKSKDALFVYDAADGTFIQKVGREGAGEQQFKRPNGISVVNNLVFVVERDNRRVQVLSLPDFKSLGFIGQNELIKPYGLFVYTDSVSVNHLLVTDNYETENGGVPADSLLGQRVKHYTWKITTGNLESKFAGTFGATSGSGTLRIVESVFGDVENNLLLFSEEDTTQSSLKVYDLQGLFSGVVRGKGLFHYQVEGIALYQNENGAGYWIITDQSKTENRFLVFERQSFKYLGAFAGPKTKNTDGIWLTQKSFGKFLKGVFFAVHDDGNVSGFDFKTIADSLNLDL